MGIFVIAMFIIMVIILLACIEHELSDISSNERQVQKTRSQCAKVINQRNVKKYRVNKYGEVYEL